MLTDNPTHILAVTALIRNDLGEVLMICNPNRGWEIPGGQVEEGESIYHALKREILEETGVNVKVGPLAGLYTNVKHPLFILAFLGEFKSGDLITTEESLQTEWVQPESVLMRVTHPAIYGRVKDLLSFNDRILYRIYHTDPYQVLEERFFE
jgi:8-oxo-dGTP diphosphatase